jgi:hypothetical protein
MNKCDTAHTIYLIPVAKTLFFLRFRSVIVIPIGVIIGHQVQYQLPIEHIQMIAQYLCDLDIPANS